MVGNPGGSWGKPCDETKGGIPGNPPEILELEPEPEPEPKLS